MSSLQVNVRLTPDVVAHIDRLVECGDFGDRSEFARYAIRKTLMVYTARGPLTSPETEEVRG